MACNQPQCSKIRKLNPQLQTLSICMHGAYWKLNCYNSIVIRLCRVWHGVWFSRFQQPEAKVVAFVREREVVVVLHAVV